MGLTTLLRLPPEHVKGNGRENVRGVVGGGTVQGRDVRGWGKLFVIDNVH